MSLEGTYCTGSLEITTTPREMRMSHWVYAPKVIDLRTNDVVLDLTGGLFDLFNATERDGKLCLTLHKYPDGSYDYSLIIDPEDGTILFGGMALTKEQAMKALHDTYNSSFNSGEQARRST